MDQLDHIHKQHQQSHKPVFDVVEPSIVRAQFQAKRDASFSSYLQHRTEQKAEDSDQISIFDAARYFSEGHDNQNDNHKALSPIQQHISSSKVLDYPSMARLSSVSSTDNNRARSFHATPTASSEASWNSQTGLLTNPHGSIGIAMISNRVSQKSGSGSNSNSNNNSNGSYRWPRISTNWLIPRGRKCPCSGKKSVQVEERIETKTPRMVDLRRSSSSNGTTASSLYSTIQNSPRKSGSTLKDPNLGLNLMARQFDPSNNSNKNPNGIAQFSPNSKMDIGANKIVVASNVASGGATSNGFTFPILDNQPVAVKKMFNVIAPQNQQDTHRDSLEVFQPRSHPSPRSRRTSYEEDNVSDGSSDLFEIESFSTSTYPRRDSIDDAISNIKRFGMVCDGSSSSISNNELVIKTTPPLCRRRSSVDEEEPMTPSVAPTECYAPTEVSIDWSVTTAEGFDRASLSNFSVSASEVGYAAMRRAAEKHSSGNHGGGEVVVEGNVGRRKGGGLLNCRCEKAVNVGPGPVKCGGEVGPPTAARHVGGRTGNVSGGSGNGKAGLMVGRQRNGLVPMSFAT